MPILITGATGFLGVHLVRALTAQGAEVRCLVRRDGVTALPPQARLYRGDVTACDSLHLPLDGVERVVHLAATIQDPEDDTWTRVNYGGTLNLLEAAARAGVKHFLHVSALGTAPEKRSPYAYSKWLAEETVKRGEIPYTILRPSVIYGEGDRFITVLVWWLRTRWWLPRPPRGRVLLQPLWVEDMVQCVLRALDHGTSQARTINLGGPERMSFGEVLETVMEVTGLRRPAIPVPPRLLRSLLRASGSHPLILAGELGCLGRDSVTEPDVVERTFGFRPQSLRAGLGRLGAMRT